MATNLFSKAAAYRKKHQGMSMPQAVKAVSKKSKPAKKKKAAAKKRATPAPKKVKTKIKIRARKKGGFNLGISGISLDKLHQEVRHLASLESTRNKHRDMLKGKGKTPAEKLHIRREIASYGKAIATSKKHITALKRSV